jgi:glucose-6-phosphate isomerase
VKLIPDPAAKALLRRRSKTGKTPQIYKNVRNAKAWFKRLQDAIT